jgi:hypothetical protein
MTSEQRNLLMLWKVRGYASTSLDVFAMLSEDVMDHLGDAKLVVWHRNSAVYIQRVENAYGVAPPFAWYHKSLYTWDMIVEAVQSRLCVSYDAVLKAASQ